MLANMEGETSYRQGRGDTATPFSWWQRVGISFLSFFGWLLVWVIGSTLRYQVEGWENFKESKQQNQPIIYCFWHNQILSATHLWRSRGIVVITSRHFDGEAIAGIIRRFGYGSARGSSSRGAASALLELKRCIEQGKDVAFTADGPRGPAYQLKKGPAWLSRKTAAAVLPFHIQPRGFWSLNSWDGFRIPKPFTRALVKIGRPLTITPEQDEPSGMAQIQFEMDRIRRECEAYWEEAIDS
jgi:hypothetical protein